MKVIQKNIVKSIFSVLLSVLFFSCAKQRDFVYFQHADHDTMAVTVALPYRPVLVSGDVVAIGVSAVDPDVVKPFNVSSSAASGTAAVVTAAAPSYLIDEQGYIEFPVLGMLKLAGLSSAESTRLIKDRIKTYVNNPMVTLKILNHKVTVLGEVKVPGVYPISNEKLTLTEALAMAGDLQLSGVRKNVLVVREIDGVKTETRVDLTSRHLFSSPVYYLHPNDLIYVQPSKSRIQASGPALQYTSMAISSLSVILNILNLVTR